MNKQKVSFFYSIRFRLVLSFLVPIVFIVALGVTSYNMASKAITDAYKDQTQQTADVLTKYISLITLTEQEEFKVYLVDQDLNYYFKGILDKTKSINVKTTYNEKLKSKLNVNANLSDIYILGDNGQTLTGNSVTTLAENVYSTFEASEEGQIVLADAFNWKLFGADYDLDAQMGTNSGTYALRYVRKLKDLPAAIVIDFSADAIRDTIGELNTGDGGYVALVTTDGKEFYSDDTVTTSGNVYGQSFYTSALSSEQESGNQMVTLNGRSYLFVYSKFDEAGDMITALIPESVILSQTEGIQRLTLILTAIAVLIALGLALLISSKMSGTIKYILGKLSRVSEGDLTTVLEAKGKDEFALLCEGVNNTVGNVKELILGVNDVSSQVSASAAYMADASDTFKATSGNIQNAVSQIEQGAGQLDLNSAECLGQMDTLSGRIAEVSTNADEIERLTRKTGEMINEGIKSVQGLTEKSRETTDITSHVIVSIKALEEKSNTIHEIVAAINSIAKQTNLLSLNAGIEAARAGEAGRGFTVVAEQIRVLSNECMESANQISKIVDEITGKTAEVASIASQAETVVASQTDVVEQTRESFDRIGEQVNSLIDALNTITDSVDQIDESRVQTLRSIESISAVSGETVTYSSEVHAATTTQTEAIDNLDEASRQLQNKADSLLSMMQTFVVE